MLLQIAGKQETSIQLHAGQGEGEKIYEHLRENKGYLTMTYVEGKYV